MLQFVVMLSLLSLISGQESDSNQCGYFVYQSTPYPLNYCMTSGSESVMYRCENDQISYNQWNNGNCSGTVVEVHHDQTSSAAIYNCDGPYLDNPSDIVDCELDLAVIDVWYEDSSCESSQPDYSISVVIDVCIAAANATHSTSTYIGCSPQGRITHDFYDSNADCSGTPHMSTNVDGSVSGSEDCIQMTCHGVQWSSYEHTAAPSNNSNTPWISSEVYSHDRGRQNEEIAFIVGAGAVLLVFWSCFFYNKCCRMKRKMVQQIEQLDLHQRDQQHGNSDDGEAEHDQSQPENVQQKYDHQKHHDHDEHLL